MVIFHGHVNLPEDNPRVQYHMPWKIISYDSQKINISDISSFFVPRNAPMMSTVQHGT